MQIKKSTHSTCKMNNNNNNVSALFLRVSTTYLSSNGCRHLTFIDEPPIEIVCARALTQIPIDIPINSTDDNNFDSIRVLLLFRLSFMYASVLQRTANSDYEQSPFISLSIYLGYDFIECSFYYQSAALSRLPSISIWITFRFEFSVKLEATLETVLERN